MLSRTHALQGSRPPEPDPDDLRRRPSSAGPRLPRRAGTSDRAGAVAAGVWRANVLLGAASFALVGIGCDLTFDTTAILDNRYPSDAAAPFVIYRANFATASFSTPTPADSSSAPQSTVPTSGDTVYVLVASGWDPAGTTAPASFLVLRSVGPYAVAANGTVHIPVSDSTFAGNCAAGSFLSQEETDVSTQAYFSDVFGPTLHYAAASCKTTSLADGGAR